MLIFGEDEPDNYTKVTFYINLVLWFIFISWSIASYVAISFRDLILQEKKINVEEIVMNRGEELGFVPNDFLDRLLTFHSVSIILWVIVLVGIILMWRKNLKFAYFFFSGTLFYIGMLIFYLNFSYWKSDTTFFDKIAFLAMNANALMYYFLLRREKSGGSISFFGESQDS